MRVLWVWQEFGRNGIAVKPAVERRRNGGYAVYVGIWLRSNSYHSTEVRELSLAVHHQPH